MQLSQLAKPGVGKLFVQRATFEKNVAAEGRTLSLQNRRVYFLCKKTHTHIKHSFCISHSGTFNAIYTVIVRTETYTIFMKFVITKVNETCATVHSFSKSS